MSKISDKLEELDVYEYCKACASIHIIEIDDTNVICGNCGIENYTDIGESDEVAKMKLN